jgi:TonB family protein
LINLAERTAFINRLPATAGMASPHFPLKDRVKNILSKERSMETQLKKSTIWMIVLIAVFIVGTITVHRLTFASAEKTVIEGLHEEVKAETGTKTDPQPAVKPAPPTVTPPSPAPQEQTETADKKKTRERKIVKPKLVKKVDPVYPDEAKEAGLEGAVVVEGITDENGKVIDAKILKGTHELLNEAAIDAVKQWKHEPYEEEGAAQKVRYKIELKFHVK